MKEILINLPEELDINGITEFSRELKTIDEGEKYVFDMGGKRFFPPFSMLFLAKQIDNFKKKHRNSEIYVRNHTNHDYAAHMGFFQAFGVDYGKKPGEASGSSTYLPITHFSVADIQNEANENLEHTGDVIERYSRQLSSMLTRQDDGDLVDTLEYSIREILRNVVEHSQSKNIWYCAQYWPSKNQVEIGVLDSGIGILKALSANPSLSTKIKSDYEALQMSLLPGISGKVYKGQRRDPNDHWGNSGYGLYMTSRLCRNGGSFFICSGQSGIFLKGDEKLEYKTDIAGTAIRMIIDTSKIESLNDRLQSFRNDGYKLAKEIGGIIDPSSASQMLSRDFKPVKGNL